MSAVPDAPDPRTVRDTRRALLIFAATCLVPLAFIVFSLTAGHTSTTGWVVTLAVVGLGYSLVLGLLRMSVHALDRAALAAALRWPDHLLIARALDVGVRPRGVRVLVATPSGLRLCELKGSEVRDVWEAAWQEVRGASVTEEDFKTGRRRTAVRVAFRDGTTRVLGFPSRTGLAHPLPLAESAAGVINRSTRPTDAVDR